MRKTIKSLSFASCLVAVGFISGCCTARTNILPKGGGSAEIVSTSASSDCCLSKAKDKAEEYCKERGKSLVVVDEKTDYHGADQTAKAALSFAGALTGTRMHGNTAEDWRTKLSFKCE